jgi:hypothetical protein
MIPATYEPSTSWRNYQRIQFIKGFYLICKLVQDLFEKYERTGDISHEHISVLLETHLRELRALSDTLYHLPDDELIDRKKQRGFDKVLSELWHELDKTRDNIRIIEAYGDDTSEEVDKMFKELNRIDKQLVTQARRNLPLQLRHARRIVDILIPLFEQILPIYRTNHVLLRTLYFDRADLDQLCEPSTVEYFFPRIFTSTAEGYMELVRALLETKHRSQAKSILEEFKTWVDKNPKFEPIYTQTLAAWEQAK